MSKSETQIAIENAIYYGHGAIIQTIKHNTAYAKAMSPYSFGLWHLDDWRCVVQYLKENKCQK